MKIEITFMSKGEEEELLRAIRPVRPITKQQLERILAARLVDIFSSPGVRMLLRPISGESDSKE